MRRRPPRTGFLLTETLLGASLIALLAGILMVTMQYKRQMNDRLDRSRDLHRRAAAALLRLQHDAPRDSRRPATQPAEADSAPHHRQAASPAASDDRPAPAIRFKVLGDDAPADHRWVRVTATGRDEASDTASLVGLVSTEAIKRRGLAP